MHDMLTTCPESIPHSAKTPRPKRTTWQCMLLKARLNKRHTADHHSNTKTRLLKQDDQDKQYWKVLGCTVEKMNHIISKK